MDICVTDAMLIFQNYNCQLGTPAEARLIKKIKFSK